MKLIENGNTHWWTNFPTPLEDCVEVKKCISTFHSTLNSLLKELVAGDEHILRACSLLAIPPPPPEARTRTLEIPMDPTTLNIANWVNKIQDFATGMVTLPQTFQVISVEAMRKKSEELEKQNSPLWAEDKAPETKNEGAIPRGKKRLPVLTRDRRSREEGVDLM